MVEVKLEVYRNLSNRQEGLDDQSPRGFELHNLRSKALHEVFDNADSLTVKDWGGTDDRTETHEGVELVIATVTPLVVKYFAEPALKYIGDKLAKKAVDETSNFIVKWIVSKLRPKQKNNEILDFTVETPDGTRVIVYPEKQNVKITIWFNDGTVSETVTMQY